MVPLAVIGALMIVSDSVAALGSVPDSPLGAIPEWFSWLDFIWDNSVVLAAFITLLASSMLMVAFSKERDEDEYVAAVRAKYLTLAFFIDFVFVAVTAFAVNGLDYLYIMSIQMFLILFLHIVMFNVAMAIIRRKAKSAREND
jgi:hypothetical protein